MRDDWFDIAEKGNLSIVKDFYFGMESLKGKESRTGYNQYNHSRHQMCLVRSKNESVKKNWCNSGAQNSVHFSISYTDHLSA